MSNATKNILLRKFFLERLNLSLVKSILFSILIVMALLLVVVSGLNSDKESKMISLDVGQKSIKINGISYPVPAITCVAEDAFNHNLIKKDKIRFRMVVDNDVTVRRFIEILGYLGESGIGRCEAHPAGKPKFIADIYLPGSGHDFYYNIMGFKEKEKERQSIDDSFSLGDGFYKITYVWIYVDKRIRMRGNYYDSWLDLAQDVPKSGKIMYSVSASDGAVMTLVIEIMAMLQQIPGAQVAFIPKCD